MSTPIRVIDLFAGPGGLGEGFSACGQTSGQHRFKIALSIERDPIAHQTLTLRAFFRELDTKGRQDYFRHLADPAGYSRADLQADHGREAAHAKLEAWCQELRPDTAEPIGETIKEALGRSDPWVLIGGPPCQAYSLAGRSRNRGIIDYVPENDPRQYLYREYLQIIADHAPAVFVMENVKGLLSAQLNGHSVFDQIRDDLEHPTTALRRMGRATSGKADLRYDIRSLVVGGLFGDDQVDDFIVKAEAYGIPQCRHRVILLGVKRGLAMPGTLDLLPGGMFLEHAIDGLPELRSGLTHGEDSADAWAGFLRKAASQSWFRELRQMDRQVADRVAQAADAITVPKAGRGAEHLDRQARIGRQWLRDWIQHEPPHGVLNHATRGHMPQDLYRYLFAACFGDVHGQSPELAKFPPGLWPLHKNVQQALGGGQFADRFRVQVRGRASTTVVSHISKDGHYYIHPSPEQCRSLTVREAARLQTFPDNYFFCGNRTQQYHQVGNAVPPLLARQVAQIVSDLLDK